MSERARAEEVVGTEPRVRRIDGAPRAGTAESLLALQRRFGNRAVGRLLARAPGAAPPAPAPAFVYPDTSTRDNAEQTARATQKRLRAELLPFMVAHANPVISNTAELFSGPTPMLTMDAITKRSDSDTKFADLGPPSWADPTLYDAFFYGTTMDNSQFHQKPMAGTLTGTTMYLRGHTSGGSVIALEEMAGMVAHEVSHWFVKQYGELPDTDKDSSSFDRYADEFRAYWIQPGGPGSGLPDADKAAAIKAHLVGTAGDPTSGYPDFQKAYWGPGNADLKAKIDALKGPIGFNVTNSIRLHRLWSLFQAREKGNADVGDIVLWISGLPIGERKEAAGSSLIKKLTNELPKADADRVRAALASMVSDKFATFIAAIASARAEDIKKAYADMTPADRQNAGANAGFLYNVGKATKDAAVRACVHAMVSTGRVAQYDAMAKFLDALRRAKADGVADGAIPDDVAATLAGLRDDARWTFLSWSDDAVKAYVDPLPPKVARALRSQLRD
jgi:hypothetical protein